METTIISNSSNAVLLLVLLLVSMSMAMVMSFSSSETVVGIHRRGGGDWQLVHESIGISAMHMQLLQGDSVLVFDRTDAGRSNLSLPEGSSCPLKPDCSAHSLLLDLHTSSLRPLTLRTDTWCSSGTLLPNGTFLQTGGYKDGDRAIRSLYTLGGSGTTANANDNANANANANADWFEFPNFLSVRRWYASNQILPDGDVIIVGGRRQFSFEFFPKKQQQPYNLPFLMQTSDGPRIENNLYPFLHLLPDGSLFVFANTRSVILDPIRNVIVKTLPPILDSIPRSYPSTGSSVLLPLHPQHPDPLTTRAEVLVCGGAPSGSYEAANTRKVFLPAAKTCGRITVTDPNPAWAMETMPMPRVMGDMVLLPTGDVLIVNGAGSGTAAWELAENPVYTPVMYSPKSPAGSRFHVLNPSQIPRLYHSSAILDIFGQVLVAGSNPHRTYDFSKMTNYPTELSMEAFHPPYLDSALSGLRPRIESGWGAVGYGERISVTFSVTGFLRWPGPEVEVVAIAPSFQTHSVGMNQRMVVLTMEGTRPAGPPFMYEADILALPTPQIVPPGYYLLFVVHAGVPSSQGVWVRFH